MAEIVVKIQRPINYLGEPMLLVYNEDRSHEFRVPCDSVPGRELLNIMGSHLKMYCRFRTPAKVENFNQWRYQGRVRDRRW